MHHSRAGCKACSMLWFSVCFTQEQTIPPRDHHYFLTTRDSPAQDHIIIKEIDLDMLQPNGLIETLRN